MAEIVISIVAKVAELLVVPVGKHICYPFKYKTNMAELKEQFAKLTDARDRVQHDIDAAERRRHEIENDVKNWMNSVDEFTKGIAKHIIDNDEDTENKAKKLCSIGFCPNMMARYSLSKKAEKTAKDGVKLLQERKFEKVSYSPDIQRTGSIYIRGYNDFDSRTSIFQDIMQTLADDNFNIIGVHGMGGVGKTTLVKRVVGKAIDDKLFDVVVMADVTQTPDIQKIQAQIADELDLKFEVESLSGRAARLRNRLKKEKRVLLVLDDLWKKLDLQDVGIPFGEGGNAEQRQCKLLLTSRDLHVLRDHMNTQRNFQLKVLTDEEAGNLFWQTVGDSTKTSDFDTTGVEIIRHCAGLPVAIATIASALKNKSPSNWKDALDQLKKSNPRHIEGMEAEVYSAIKLSYDFLQSEEEKSVFLLCSLYNASFNIDIDYLLQYCIGLGVFQGVSTIEQARNRLHKIIDKLKASHLLLDGNPSHPLFDGNTKMCVKMHDIVHAVAISIASTDKLMFNIQDVTDLKETLVEKLPKNSTAMSLPFKDVSELPERLESPELELLVLLTKETFFSPKKGNTFLIPDPFFGRMEGLKVLHLNKIHMLSLPSSLCRLTSLQTLRLNQCLLGDIAVIGVLKRIEILSFLSSTIEQLPRDLSQLTRLRLLDLRYCSNLKVISPNLISSLTRLEELYIGNSFVEWDVEGRSNASLVELKQLSRLKRLDICVHDSRIIPQDLLIFQKLESYIIYIGDVWKRPDLIEYHWRMKLNNLDNYFESSKMLKLKLNDSNIYLGNDFRLLLNRAEDLHLDELKGVKNVVCQLDGEGFPQLKHLYVRNDAEIQYIISAIGRDLCNVFPKLELLLLNKLVNLKKICHGQLAPESFNKLRIMKVENCDTLNHLFSFSMVKNLSQLQEIEVTNCKNLEVIIFKESEEQVQQNDRISRVEFTQLHTLTLKDLPRLTSFVFHSLLPNTESQEIVSEDQPRGFMSLFSQNVAFPCLKELTLQKLPELLHLWKEDSQPRIVFENLTNLNVSYCENLKTLVPFSVPLEKLTTLTVQNCNGLMNLMTLSTAKTLVQLKKITIEGCRMLEEIITDVGDEAIRTAEAEKDAAIDKITLSMLNSIRLARLPNLITFHSRNNTVECYSLIDIYITDCPKMEAFVFLDTKDPSIRSASLFNEKVVLPISASLHPLDISIHHLRAISSCPTNLTRLTMGGFDNLKYLFPSSMAESLVHLGFLHISNCKLMEVVIITREERKSSTLFSKLNQLRLEDLPELRTFCCFTGNLIKLPSLNKLHIKNCPTMQTLASDSLCVDMLAIEEEPEEVNTEKEENLLSFFDEKVAFPCLKELTLQKLPELLHLWKEDSQPRIVFENLTNLNVSYCENLKTLVPFSVPLEKLTTLTVMGCNGLMNLMTFSTAKTLVQLKEITIEDCDMLEEIITDVGDEEIRTAEAEKDDKITMSMLNSIRLARLPNLITFHSGSNTLECPSLTDVQIRDCPKMEAFVFPDTKDPSIRSASLFNKKVAFPCLKELRLERLHELLHLWKEDSQPRIFFENLANLNVSYCENLKTLGSSLVLLEKLTTLTVWCCNGLMNLMTFSTAKTLVQLKTITIKNCDMIEEIITDVGDEEIRTAEAEKDAAIDKITLSMLNSITLDSLPNLITFHSGSNPLECPSLIDIFIENCPKMEAFVFPDTKDPSIRSASLFNEKVAFPCLKELRLKQLHELLHLWKEDSQPRIFFENLANLDVSFCENLKTLGPSLVLLEKLTTLTVRGCNGLMNLMTFSTAKTLVQLKTITIKDCDMLEEIITDVGDEEIRTAEAEKDAAIDKITLSMLNSITLDSLPNLITFHLGSNPLECPSLIDIFIENCPKMEAFVFPDTKDPSIRSASLFNEKVAFPCLKELRLKQLHELLHLWKEDSQPRIFFENLANLDVSYCENLKTLGPSLVLLEKLTTLTVRGCNGLMNLMTFSTAKTLVQLKTITIKDCDMLEEIITDVGDEEIRTAEAEKDAAIDKITLSMLNSITLDSLPNLITFHSGSNTLECPSLTLIFIENCPKMEAFVFPNRKDLSIRIGSHFSEKAMSSCPKNLTKLTMEGFDNLKYLFPSSMAESLVHLGFLHISNCKLMEVVIITQEERKSVTLFPKLNQLRLVDLPELRTCCFFTGNLIKLPSLNKLGIKNCPTMQTFASDSLCVDMLAIEEEPEEVNTEREEKRLIIPFFDEKVALPCLKGLVLRKLPGLLHLWKENSQPSKVFENLSHLRVVGCGNLTTLLPSSVSLQNLMLLDVRKCDGLINLVPFSTAQSLKQLKIMIISDCKMIEEIIIDMGDEVKDKIVFDQLINLALHCLPSLTSFCKGNFTIEFPSLRRVIVIKCLKMMSFSQEALSTPKLRRLVLIEVDTDDFDDDDYDDDEWDWEGDLNTSIQQFFEDRKKMAEEIRFFKLKTGAEIPSVGLGTWFSAPGVVSDAVSTAVKVGYRHIDCAPLYGNEKEIGCALKRLLDDGVVEREELWITSKLWCTDHLPVDVPKAMDRTLQDLQLDYLDLYLIHWPVSLKKGSDVKNPENLTQPDIPSTWRAMEALYDSGKARAIGVSNFSIKKLGDLLDIARVPPAVNQVECHPSWKQTKLHAFCKSKEVHLSGYSPLGSPSNKYEKEVLKDPILNMVALKLGKSPAQVALRWGLQMGHSVLPKSTNEARLKENYDVFGWYIPIDFLAELSEIDQERLVKGTHFVHENFGAYRTLEELWDGEI